MNNKQYLIFTLQDELKETTDSELKTIEKYNTDLICCYEDENTIIFCDCAADEIEVADAIFHYLQIDFDTIANATCGMFADKF